MESIYVKNTEISIQKIDNEDFVSLTDMIKAKDGSFFISDWLRNRNTIEFLGIWEKIHNPHFNYGEFAIIKSKSGLNSYKLSVKEWINKTNAIGLTSTPGRYGGTYAHKDLALEFGMWISAEFKIYLIKEFQRLNEVEHKNNDWNLCRALTKINYTIHTDSIKKYLIPKKIFPSGKIYADEADILNIALFGKTAKEWRDENIHLKGNIRDYSDVLQLVCLSNLENLNAFFIKQNISQEERLLKLNSIAIEQLSVLSKDIKKMEEYEL